MNPTICTSEVPPPERFDYWRSQVTRCFMPFELRRLPDNAAFDGRIVERMRGDTVFSEVSADGHQLSRRLHGQLRGDEDYFLLLLLREGRTVMEQPGRSAAMLPGDMVLCDASRDYLLHLPGRFSHDVLMLPGTALRRALPGAWRHAGQLLPANTAATHLLRDCMVSLRHHADRLPAEGVNATAAAALELLCAALRGMGGVANPQLRSDRLRGYHQRRLQAYVMAHLHESTLGVAQIAGALRMSTRQVHKLCEDQPLTLSAWIRKERLDAARRQLEGRGAASLGIAELAWSLGFQSPAHFSRLFRAAFACSPREYRERARARGK